MAGIIRDWAAATNGAQGVPVETTRALRVELGQKYQQALNQTYGNHEEAEKKLAEAINFDRRYDAYPTDRLVRRFRDCYQNSAVLDFDDPWLRGGPERPCQFRNSRTG